MMTVIAFKFWGGTRESGRVLQASNAKAGKHLYRKYAYTLKFPK